MKKVLILAYEFPPYGSVAGLRPNSWYKYMKDFDIYPIVITRQWNNMYGNSFDYVAKSEYPYPLVEETSHGTIIRVGYKPNLSNRLLIKYGEKRFKLLRKIVTLFYEITQYYIPVGAKRNVYKAARKYMSKYQPEAIIATGDPFILFRYASKLSDEFNIPWIADYRDAWSNDISINKNRIWSWFNRIQEKRYVSKANMITTVSDFIAHYIRKVNPKEVKIIPNGYDGEVLNKTLNVIPRNDVLSICFVGTIYKWNPINAFLSVVAELS